MPPSARVIADSFPVDLALTRASSAFSVGSARADPKKNDGVGNPVTREPRLRLEIFAQDPERSCFTAHHEVGVLVGFVHGACMIAHMVATIRQLSA
jgi:hypothetical protein